MESPKSQIRIRREVKKQNFSVFQNSLLQDPNLSPASLGVLLYILSKPDNWQAHKWEIVHHFSNSKVSALRPKDNTMDNIFKELRQAGYIKLVPIQTMGDDGKMRFAGSEYVFSEMPLYSVVEDFRQSSELAGDILTNTEYSLTNKEQLLAAEPEITPNRESFDQFSSKYELQFTPAILSDAKAKLELYYKDNDISQELELAEPISQEKFKEELLSFLTKRVEGTYKKSFKSFAAMHTDFLTWVKKSLSFQKYTKKETTTPTSSAPLPHREAHELDDTALQAAIDELGVADKTTAGRIRNRIKPLLAFIKAKAAKLGVIQKMSGLTELQCVFIMRTLNFAQYPKFSMYEGVIDQIPQRKELMQCSSIGEVLRVFSNLPPNEQRL